MVMENRVDIQTIEWMKKKKQNNGLQPTTTLTTATDKVTMEIRFTSEWINQHQKPEEEENDNERKKQRKCEKWGNKK